MVKIVPSAENSVFALDIGTRTVIGIVAMLESGSLRIVAQHMMEHGSRAMFDGQIHNIPKVADTVQEVKRVLEKKVGFKLTKAAIAAAGRALITKHCRTEIEINDQIEIDNIIVNSLEVSGVRNACKEIEPVVAGDSEKYFCIGYSVIKYYLNSYPMTNLVGHRGKTIAADVIATFLPESVINSLYAVLGRTGLEPLSMTLEPIAAIEVLIPENMRLLNLALIDIGAGTSDIAITRKGSVVSYGMVPIAGDEITEAVAESLLVDFNWAEKIKRALDGNGEIVYSDVLDVEHKITGKEIYELLEPMLDKLSDELARSIVELNGGEPPRSVFCIGGGSRIPVLNDKIAERLNLPAQKVATRGRGAVQNLVVEEDGLEGPEGVTVVGIAAVAIKKIGQNFIKIKVDGKEFSLFNRKGLNVANALSLLDFNPRDLIGKNGSDLRFTLDNQPRVIYGGFARPAEIYINGNKANLQTAIADGDDISIFKAEYGADAKACVGDLLPDMDLSEGTILVNGAEADAGYMLRENDEITLVPKRPAEPPGEEHAVNMGEDAAALQNSKILKDIFVTVNGDRLHLTGKEVYIFVDVFNYIDVNLTTITDMPLFTLNGSTVEFTDILSDGDIIEIIWK